MSDGAGDVDPEMARLMTQAFLDVPLHGLLGLEVIDVGRPGVAAMAIPLQQPALGATGQLHGGVVAVLCDLVCAAAATTSTSYDHTTTALVTADLHVRYLGAARGDRVRAEAQVVKAGRTLIVVEADVIDAEDRLVARADFSASLVPLRTPLGG
jgi:acyl-CoA thioesterase